MLRKFESLGKVTRNEEYKDRRMHGLAYGHMMIGWGLERAADWKGTVSPIEDSS